MRQIEGQLTITDYLSARKERTWGGCTGCACENCLYRESQRCPYGKCWDDHRADVDPYDRAHPDQPPRTWWSDWNKPGEQAHWCRGGRNYPVYYCPHFVKYKGLQVKTCLKENVCIFQDGYILCGIIDSYGCERCYQEFLEKEERDSDKR